MELSNLEKRVLNALREVGGNAVPSALVGMQGLDNVAQVNGATSWLESKGLLEVIDSEEFWVSLGQVGRGAVGSGLPEEQLLWWLFVTEKSPENSLQHRVDVVKDLLSFSDQELAVATGWLRKRKYVEVISTPDGQFFHLKKDRLPMAGLLNALMRQIDGFHQDLTVNEEGEQGPPQPARWGFTPEGLQLSRIASAGKVRDKEIDPEIYADMRRRKGLIEVNRVTSRILRLTMAGEHLTDEELEVRRELTDYSGEEVRRWAQYDFRPYDVTAFAPVATGGKRHPLRQIIDQTRQVFLEMGFTEIEGPYARNAFWNMDALFIPQDHPARAMQDTFYLDAPARARVPDDEARRVKAVQEHGGDTGSRGWRNPWSREVAEQTLLRTHTTVDTIQYLARHPKPPVKVFSVDRVFRNEAIDATHLPEFHQVEGIVMEEGANLRQLIGLLREFYAKMGFDKVTVRPSYYPYTEPSIDIAVFYNDKWLELGGAGIFRREVTQPWGIDSPVLAWGLGLERLAMMRLGLKDLRELYVSDVEWLRSAAAVK